MDRKSASFFMYSVLMSLSVYPCSLLEFYTYSFSLFPRRQAEVPAFGVLYIIPALKTVLLLLKEPHHNTELSNRLILQWSPQGQKFLLAGRASHN